MTAIAQLVAVLCGLVQYAKYLYRGTSLPWDGERIFDLANWTVHLVAAIMLIVFLFTLVSRQKSN